MQLEPFNLTKSELLVILNTRPQDQSLLDCVVEECDERFSTEQQDEILRIVRDVLGGDEEQGEGEERNGDGDAVAGMAEARGD